MNNKILVATYSHPEFYPPTLNALRILSEIYDEITVLHRPFYDGLSLKSDKIKLISSGKSISIKTQENSSIFRKIGFFLRFTRDLYKLIKISDPNVVLLYDGLPILSLRLILCFTRKKYQIWYHNHDVYEKRYLRKYTLSWLAFLSHRKTFKYVDIFTLPAIERKDHFDLINFNGRYWTLPNYPSRLFTNDTHGSKIATNHIKILYQGSIGTGHGIEEIIRNLKLKVNDKDLSLVLKGFITDKFKDELLGIAKDYQVEDKIQFIGISTYEEVKLITAQCHIGIAIFAKDDVMNRTLGTASNKIYEYAANGLPILYYKNEHFDKYLKRYRWAFGVNNSSDSILEAIKIIDSDYSRLSSLAKDSVLNDLNFEKVFDPIKQHLTDNL